MKKPNITDGEWVLSKKDKSFMPWICELPNCKVITLDGCTVDTEYSDAKAISAVPELIDEGIKAIKHLHNYWYEGAISDGQSHDAAEDFAQRKTKGLYKALEKAGVEL